MLEAHSPLTHLPTCFYFIYLLSPSRILWFCTYLFKPCWNSTLLFWVLHKMVQYHLSSPLCIRCCLDTLRGYLKMERCPGGVRTSLKMVLSG